jgi:hypothetical protein
VKFQLIQKTYPGTYPRPSVNIELHEDGKLVIMAIPWGATQASKTATDIIKDYFNSSMADPDSTTPFAKMPSLSQHANGLRISTLLANDAVYQKYNTQDYKAGCEITTIYLHNNEATWIHYGQPHIFLARADNLHLLQGAQDLGFQFDNPYSLPEKQLGVSRTIDVESHSTILKPGDKLVLLARKTIPNAFFSKSFKGESCASLCQNLFDLSIDEKNDTPFWLGILDTI